MIRFIFIISLFPMVAFAQPSRESSGSGGNGGQSVVCGDSVAAYDLFEGAKLFSYSYNRVVGTDALQSAMRITTELDALSPGKAFSFSMRLKKVAEQMAEDATNCRSRRDREYRIG